MEGYSCIMIGAFTKVESMTRIVKGARSGLPCPFCEIMGPAFATILYEILDEIATIPTMSA